MDDELIRRLIDVLWKIESNTCIIKDELRKLREDLKNIGATETK